MRRILEINNSATTTPNFAYNILVRRLRVPYLSKNFCFALIALIENQAASVAIKNQLRRAEVPDNTDLKATLV